MEIPTQAGLIAALAAAQGEFPTIPRSRSVEVRMKSGGTYHFKYAPMEVIIGCIRPVLSKHGIALTQTIEGGCMWTILSNGDSSLKLAPVPMGFREGMSAQDMGSELTYKQRYSLKIALCLATDDDDDANMKDGNSWTAADKSAPTVDVTAERAALEAATSVKDVAKVWNAMTVEQRVVLAALKTEMVAKLTAKPEGDTQP